MIRRIDMDERTRKTDVSGQNATPDNTAIAAALDELADRLDERGANEHRVRAYRRAAETVRSATRPLAEMLTEGGPGALEALPGIGENIAGRIAGFAETGRLRFLHRLREETSPVRLFMRVPGLGRERAERIHAALPDLDTLEELEVAAHDGRLRSVEGFGSRRVQQVRAQLGDMLKGHSTRRRGRRRSRRSYRSARDARPGRAEHTPKQPPVETLLAADREYRRKVQQDALRRIAPRRFNPENEAWLPIMKSRQGDWAVTALFSNTARAHRLGTTDDWVVLYTLLAGLPNSEETQHTVVTETRGDLRGRRVVRGREGACRTYYREQGELTAAV